MAKERNSLERFLNVIRLLRGDRRRFQSTLCSSMSNHHCRLSLEWNSIGTNEDGFKELCEGLELNASLQYLDLRSNNIDPNGAIQLSTAFLSNNTLLEVGKLTRTRDQQIN